MASFHESMPPPAGAVTHILLIELGPPYDADGTGAAKLHQSRLTIFCGAAGAGGGCTTIGAASAMMGDFCDGDGTSGAAGAS